MTNSSVAATYCSMLEDGPLDIIARFLSPVPAFNNWPSNTPASQAHLLFALQGPLGDVFRARFTSISLLPKRGAMGEDSDAEKRYIKFDESTFSELSDSEMKRAVSRIQHMKISDTVCYTNGGDVNFHTFRFARWASTETPNLSHLSVSRVRDVHFNEILKAKKSSLTSLKLDPIASSNEHLFFVKEISNVESPLLLRKLEISRFGDVNISPDFWRSIGSSLTHLTITVRSECSGQRCLKLDNVGTYCPNITHLELISCKTLASLYPILMALGRSLRHVRAEFSGIGFAKLEDVDKACPNAEFHFLEKPPVMIYKKVHFRAPVLNIAGGIVIPDDVRFFDTYYRLRELTLNIKDEQRIIRWMTALLHVPKPNLECITVASKMFAPHAYEEFLHILAKKVSSLERISLQCTRLPTEKLRDLIEANGGLKYIALEVKDVPLEEDLLRLLNINNNKKFASKAVCVQLWDKNATPNRNIESIVRLRNSCFSLRRRYSSIRILGIEYIP